LAQLDNIDHKIPSLGESIINSVTRIEGLLKNSTIIETSNDIKLRAAQRAIEKKAPFHLKKNSIADAIIIETYADCVLSKNYGGDRFAFITHNTSDFSLPGGNNQLPHPDLAPLFSKRRSLYFIKLSEALNKYCPEYVSESIIEAEEFSEEPRSLTSILQMISELIDKVWYNRHQNWLYKIETGEHKIVERSSSETYSHNSTPRDIWEGAKKSAKKVEDRYSIENLGPWDDFEWGMLNGKLSALRWVLGEEWDSLDT
jgi:hypothetical protein